MLYTFYDYGSLVGSILVLMTYCPLAVKLKFRFHTNVESPGSFIIHNSASNKLKC